MTQLQRLEALLTRVQENRSKPRLAVFAGAAQPAPAADQKPAIAQPAAKAAIEQRAPIAPAVEPKKPAAHVEKPAAVAAPASPQPSTSHTTPGVAAPQTAPEAVVQKAAKAPLQAERVELAVPAVKGAVAAVVTQAPALRELSFGELVGRSLALRPR